MTEFGQRKKSLPGRLPSGNADFNRDCEVKRENLGRSYMFRLEVCDAVEVCPRKVEIRYGFYGFDKIAIQFN